MAFRLALTAFFLPFLLCFSWASPHEDIRALAALSDFDYYRLILVWPGSICNSQDAGACCEPYTGDPAVDFLVQDLQTWNSTNQVEGCSGDRFYINAINRTVRLAMMEYWTTLDCPSTSPQQMWNATWLASGKCSGGNWTVFFKTGLDIAKQANVLGGLAAHEIVPSNNSTYQLEDIGNALQKSIGTNVVITCNNNTAGESQIYNVHVCAKKDGSALTDCPPTNSSCPQAVKFPVFTTDMLNDTSTNAVHLEMVV